MPLDRHGISRRLASATRGRTAQSRSVNDPRTTLRIAKERWRLQVVPAGYGGPVILDSLDVTPAQFAAGTGWEIKPEGACKAEVCVPLDRLGFDLVRTAERLRMALVRDEDAGLWALGPESLGDRALLTAEAPELVLDDLDGRPFRLSSLRGQKVVLVAWAPY